VVAEIIGVRKLTKLFITTIIKKTIAKTVARMASANSRFKKRLNSGGFKIMKSILASCY
jgi:hypothetical protein